MPTFRSNNHARSRAALISLGVAVLLAGLASCSSDNGSDNSSGDRPTTTAATTTPTTIADTAIGGSFSLIAYNVAGLPQEISKENPKEHIPLISPLLEPYDIVLTQEDFDWWQGLADGFDFVNYHARLRADVTHEYQTAQHPGPEAVGLDPLSRELQIGDGQGILSRFPFTDEQRVPWAGCFGGFDTSDGGAGDCLAMKGFAVVTMSLADGALVDVYTLHVEAGGSEIDQSLQADDIAQLTAFMAEHSNGRAVILGGDTNLHLDRDNPDATGESDGELWNGLLVDLKLADVCVELDCESPNRIDKVAYRSSDDVRLSATSYEVPADTFVDAEGAPLSDHEPVVVEFDWEFSR